MALTNGLVVMTPTSVNVQNGSASIRSDGSVVFTSIDVAWINGVFTSAFDNYMVVMRSSEASYGSGWIMRLSAGGTANSVSSSYTTQYIWAGGTSVTAGRSALNYFTTGFTNNVKSGQTVYFFGPNLTQPTAIRSVTAGGYPPATPANIVDTAVTHNQNYSADGFSLIPGSTYASTGLLTVFGFNQ